MHVAHTQSPRVNELVLGLVLLFDVLYSSAAGPCIPPYKLQDAPY
jgi:hypothetical protein